MQTFQTFDANLCYYIFIFLYYIVFISSSGDATLSSSSSSSPSLDSLLMRFDRHVYEATKRQLAFIESRDVSRGDELALRRMRNENASREQRLRDYFSLSARDQSPETAEKERKSGDTTLTKEPATFEHITHIFHELALKPVEQLLLSLNENANRNSDGLVIVVDSRYSKLFLNAFNALKPSPMRFSMALDSYLHPATKYLESEVKCMEQEEQQAEEEDEDEEELAETSERRRRHLTHSHAGGGGKNPLVSQASHTNRSLHDSSQTGSFTGGALDATTTTTTTTLNTTQHNHHQHQQQHRSVKVAKASIKPRYTSNPRLAVTLLNERPQSPFVRLRVDHCERAARRVRDSTGLLVSQTATGNCITRSYLETTAFRHVLKSERVCVIGCPEPPAAASVGKQQSRLRFERFLDKGFVRLRHIAALLNTEPVFGKRASKHELMYALETNHVVFVSTPSTNEPDAALMCAVSRDHYPSSMSHEYDKYCTLDSGDLSQLDMSRCHLLVLDCYSTLGHVARLRLANKLIARGCRAVLCVMSPIADKHMSRFYSLFFEKMRRGRHNNAKGANSSARLLLKLKRKFHKSSLFELK